MDNFKDTAYRMYDDAEVLINSEKYFNACYLSGYVLECYCKLVLDNAITQGIIPNRTIRSYSHNVNRMEDDLNMITISQAQLSRYCIDLSSECSNLLEEWKPTDRYDSDNGRWNDKNKANTYKEETEKLIEQIIKMDVDGVI